MGEHSVLSESSKQGALGSSSPCPGGVVQVVGPGQLEICEKLSQKCENSHFLPMALRANE